MNSYLIILLLVISFACNSQKKSQQQEFELKVKDSRFKSFLSSFNQVEFPLNYTKETEKIIDQTVRVKRLTKDDAIKFLKIPNRALNYDEVQYDYDTDRKTIKSVENPPYAHFKHFAKEHIVTCIRHDRGPESDSLFVYIYTFDYKGKLIDRALVGGQLTRESDWSSFYIEESSVKVYKYRLNSENFIIKNNTFQIKDKEKPMSVVVIETYVIDDSGKILRTKVSDKAYLKFDLETYKRFSPESDDPINQN